MNSLSMVTLALPDAPLPKFESMGEVIDLLANDSDASGIALAGIGAGANGTAVINVDGTGMRVVLPRQSAGIDFYDWSADGGSILASVREGNISRLGVVSVRDGSFVELKTGGDIGNAALSPDGRFVVYGNWQDAIAWGLKPFEIDVAVKRMAEVLQIGKLLNKRPSALSGACTARAWAATAASRSRAAFAAGPSAAMSASP